MNSIAVLFTISCALFAATNALQCRPVMCMLACPFGFDVDVNGCEHCSCRKTPNVCYEPIFGYNCGSIEHHACPSTHECQPELGGMIGQCCLKRSGSTTSKPVSGTSTARPATGTSTTNPGTGASTSKPNTSTAGGSTRRHMRRLLATGTGPSTSPPRSTPRPSSTSRTPVSSTRVTRPATTTGRWATLVNTKFLLDD